MFKVPENEARITKELILSKVSEENLMSHYLGIPVKKGIFINPLRNDKKPTASFYRNNKGDLIFKDFGNNFSGNFISVVMEIFKCSYYKSLKIIANDFDIIKSENYEKHSPKIEYNNEEFTEKHSTSVIQVEIQEFSKKELAWWNSFGISKTTLAKYKVVSCKSVFLNYNYFCSSSDSSPIYGYYGGKKEDGVELWRIYMPTKRTFRFLSNWSSNLLQGMKQIDKDSTHCIISKSMKDLMLLHEFGFNAIAPTSETILITENRFNKLNSHYKDGVILFFDNDLAGVKAGQKYKKEYKCRCVFISRRWAKDISDLYKSLSIKQFWEVVDELNLIIQNPTITKTKHFYIFN